jgi:hypothetical protein
MIERNRNPIGRLGNIVFGLATLADGLIRVISLGYLHTRFPVNLSKSQTKRYLMRIKAARVVGKQ